MSGPSKRMVPILVALLALVPALAAAQVCWPFMVLQCRPVVDPWSWIEGLEVSVGGVIWAEPPCDPFTRMHWSWGDGTEGDSGGFPTSHVYPAPGTYRVEARAFDSADQPLIAAACSLEVGLYSTNFEALAPGSANGQDGWCIGDVSDFPGMTSCHASADGTLIDDGTGNQVLEIRARLGWGEEVGRDLLAPSTKRYLRVEMEAEVVDSGAFWFMDNFHEGDLGKDVHHWLGQPDTALAQCNADPGLGSLAFPLATRHAVGLEVDQTARVITGYQLDGRWRREDDSAGVSDPGGHTRFLFRGTGTDSRLRVDNLAITEHDDSVLTRPGPRRDWRLTRTTPQVARSSAGLAYDAQRRRLVMFGGRNPQPLADTWELDGGAWVQVFPSHSPAARFWHAMTWDGHRQRVVLFGGGDPDTGTYRSDTWEYDGADWQQMTPAHSPPPMIVTSMAFDSLRNRVVLVGGEGPSGAFDATWEYDGVDWTQVSTTFSPTPPGALAALAFDAARGRMVLVGYDDGPGTSATWEYDGASWAAISTHSFPPHRWAHALVYDGARQRIVLFGGYSPGSAGGTAMDDTWEYDGADWTQISSPHRPPAVEQHVMVYDSTRQSAVMQSWADTWRYGDLAELVFLNEWIGASCCSEITQYTLAEDFELPAQERLTSVEFAMDDLAGTFPANWDGNLQYWIWADDDGYPGALLAAGQGANVTPTPESDRHYRVSFDLEAPVVAQRNRDYWLGIHMAEDWSGADQILWTLTDSGFGNTARVDDGSGTAWSDSAHHLAFAIYADPDFIFADDFESGDSSAW